MKKHVIFLIKDLHKKAKLSVYRLVFLPSPVVKTFCVETNGVRSWTQEVKMSSLHAG